EPSSLGIITLSGFNVSLSVDKDCLVIKDGTGNHRREARFHRALASFSRIVIHGHTGYITLDALKWLYDKGIALLQINYDATLIFANSPFKIDNPRLRRQQVAASVGDVGISIARYLIRQKIIGQLHVLKARYNNNNSELNQY